MKIKHEGMNHHRIKTNPLEALYAEEWARQAPTILGYIICGQDKNFHDVTPRDAEVAATLIQWLGSPVGYSFVDEVLRKYEEFKKKG